LFTALWCWAVRQLSTRSSSSLFSQQDFIDREAPFGHVTPTATHR
jgi:hypothetical protein